MAENYTGLFQTPEALQAARDAALQQQANIYAKQDPMEAARALEYTSGARLGKAFGGLLGVQDKELQAVAEINDLVKATDMTDEESVKKLAITLGQRGHKQAGELAYKKYMEMVTAKANLEGTKAKTQKELALADAANARAERELRVAEEAAKGEGFKNLPPEVQTILKISQLDPTFDKVKAMKDYLEGKGKGEWSEPYTLGGATVQRNSKTGEIRTAVSRPPVTTVNTGGTEKPLSTKDIQEINKLRSNVTVASTNVTKADDYLKKLDDRIASFGVGPNAATALRTFFSATNEGDRLKQDINRFTTASVNAVLNLAKGPQTDADAKRAQEQILTALQKNDVESVKAGLRELRRIHEEMKTNDSESLDLFGRERKRDLTPKQGDKTAPLGTKDNPIKLN